MWRFCLERQTQHPRANGALQAKVESVQNYIGRVNWRTPAHTNQRSRARGALAKHRETQMPILREGYGRPRRHRGGCLPASAA